VHIKCISNYSTHEKLSENKSCIGWIAGMSYYIFLKSLRSLEEFRKNPHVKIPPKSPSTIFQSLAIIKNQILFEKEFFLHFWPNRPSGQPAHPASQPSWPHHPPSFPQATRACSAHPGLRGHGVFAKSRLFFEFAQPATTPSPSVTAKWAPPVSSIFHLAPADPGHAAALPHLSRPPRATQPLPRDAESRS
jgi:hypothetical protein